MSPTLTQRLLRSVLVPLACTWIAGSVVAFAVAQYFAQHAFDRALLDDAYLLAAHVHAENAEQRQLALDLTPSEVNTVLFDQAETMYFSVWGPDGRLLAGHQELVVHPPKGHEAFRFDDIAYAGQLLRAVALHNESPERFDVVVAQTTTSRDAALRQLMLYSLLPQLLLLLALAWWLRRSIRHDLQPLATLRGAVEHRGSQDLAPVPVEGTTQDVQTLAIAINALLQRLERSIRAQREFAGNVAHELRTPLAGIRALAEYGLGREDPALWRSQLAAIASSEARATSMVDRLLALAVAAEAESGLALKPTALDAFVRETLLRYLRRADAAGVDLGARGIDTPSWIAAEPTLLEGILGNLIDNALRYAVADNPAPSVTVAVERRGDEVLLSVQDNGPGVSREQQRALAERGAQGEAGQLLGKGVGLGLALVAQYARLMNARMALRTGEDGRGFVCEIAFRALSVER